MTAFGKSGHSQFAVPKIKFWAAALPLETYIQLELGERAAAGHLQPLDIPELRPKIDLPKQDSRQ